MMDDKKTTRRFGGFNAGSRTGGGMMDEKKTTRRKLFFQSAAPDFILVAAVSAALVFTVSFAFNSADAYRGNVFLIVFATLPMLLALFVGLWSKKAMVLSAVLALAVAIVTIALCAAAMPEGVGIFEGGALNDVSDNYVIFGFILVVTPILVFLLSRRMVFLVVLLLLGVLACGVVQFLYRDYIAEGGAGLVAAFVVTLLGIVMMFVYQSYKQSVYKARRAKRTAFAGAFGFSALIGAVFVLIGLIAFYGVVDGLGLSTQEVKLYEKLWAAPEVERTGTVKDVETPDEDQTTDDTNDEEKDSKNDAEGGDQSDTDNDSGDQSGNPLNGLTKLLSAFDVRNWNQDYDPIGYHFPDWAKYVAPSVAAALIVGVILFWRLRRKLRLKRMAEKSYAYRMWYLYTFLVERYGRLKIRKPGYLTPFEFAVGAERVMLPFAEGTDGVDFVAVTAAYQDVCYGGREATAEDYGRLESYYNAFFRNARRHVGGFKWLWKFWRI
jgi:hypothetical protein